jgi:hypothetical protein
MTTSGWVHVETRGNLADTSLDKRIASGQWDDSAAAVADFRLLLADLATRAATCTAAPPAVTLPDFPNAPYHSRELRTITGALLRSIPLLGGGGELAGAPVGTIDGNPGQVIKDADTAALLEHLKGHALIACLGPMGLPLQLAYAAQNAPALVREKIARGGAHEELVIWSRHLVDTVVMHQLGEQSAGHAYGYTADERSVVDRVIDVQTKFAKLFSLPWLIPGADALAFLLGPHAKDPPPTDLSTLFKTFGGGMAVGALGLAGGLVAWKLWR